MLHTNKPTRLQDDAWLSPFLPEIRRRKAYMAARAKPLLDHADWHLEFGLHRLKNGMWRFREWLPNATAVKLVGSFCDWNLEKAYTLTPRENGVWEGVFPREAIRHGDLYGMHVEWPGGSGYRIPASATYVTRQVSRVNEYGVEFNARVWEPTSPYRWQHTSPHAAAPLIYEAHVGMATQEERVGSFAEFTANVLPRIAAGGYNTVQLMGIQQHPFYGSFGYHVSNFFSLCDLFGTPDDFKRLVDTAHGLGLRVIIDLVHSHAVKNPVEGLGCQDGTEWLYFHAGPRGHHPAWDSRCFDYGKAEVCRFLLSNCRFWLEEYHLDGFRFDGVTSMMYLDHGLGRSFIGYADYFTPNTDWDALAYLAMANTLIHRIRRDAWTIAEDVSGMPGLAAPVSQGGLGFDYRLAMGVTDEWFKLTDIPRDEDWPLGTLWHELTNHRADEKCISYVECHDQALVGGKSFLFTLVDAAMYTQMHIGSQCLAVDRGIALHKMARLLTLATSNHGYLNFMGNEFGHPEWIDFPREGNNWSYHYARRQWGLRDNPSLRFKALGDFDTALLSLIRANRAFFQQHPQLISLDDTAKIIMFERAGLFFAFNFHPTQTYPHCRMRVMSGTYAPVLDTDQTQFGGFNLIGTGWTTTAQSTVEDNCENWYIELNLPPRTAIVLKRR